MITDLAPFIVFLHGLSGSGKGEMKSQLSKQCDDCGYRVFYASSGDLFRAAREDLTIAEQMKDGKFIETLGPIMPGLKAIYEAFVVTWLDSGRAVLILDGVIRRSAFDNANGDHVPSQIDQLAAGMHEVNARVAQSYHSRLARVLFGSIADSGVESGIAQCKELIRSAVHVLLDVRPQDAENQMRQRAEQELQHIRELLDTDTAIRRLSPTVQDFVKDAVDKLVSLVHGMTFQRAAQRADDEDFVVSYSEAHAAPGEERFDLADKQVTSLREQLAEVFDPPSTSFVDLFNEMGIDTNLRADDVSPKGRRTRISNFIEVTSGPKGSIYAPGFAAKALADGLCFEWVPDGTFASTARNCMVIRNGASQGIGLADLRRACGRRAKVIVTRAERRRLALHGR